MAIANNTGRKVNATSPVLVIQCQITGSGPQARNGSSFCTVALPNEEPTPSMMPQNASSATGSMKVLPKPCRNSHRLPDFFTGAATAAAVIWCSAHRKIVSTS